MKKVLKYPVVILLFGVVVLFFLLNLITPSKGFSEMENRYLDQMPSFSFKAMLDSSSKGFAQRFESYANDQFFMRDGWIALKSRCEALLGKIENNGIIYGENDYLFDKYRSFDEARLSKNVSLLENFSELNPDLNKYIMVIPASYNVLESYMPKGVGNIDQFSQIEKVYSKLENADYQTIDAAAKLIEHNTEDIYYRTDHHWTTLGAWYGYQAFAEKAGFDAIKPDEALKKSSEGFWGTYFSKAQKYNAVSDTIYYYDLPIDSVLINGEPKNGMYDLSQLSVRDKYAMFLHANNGITVIENEAAESENSVMVIKDSYANCFVPFLTQNYQKVVVIDLRSLPKGLNQIIKDEAIDDLLILYSFSNLASDTNLPRLKY